MIEEVKRNLEQTIKKGGNKEVTKKLKEKLDSLKEKTVNK